MSIKNRIVHYSGEFIRQSNKIDELRRKKRQLSIFNFRGRRSIKKEIRVAEKQIDHLFNQLEILNEQASDSLMKMNYDK